MHIIAKQNLNINNIVKKDNNPPKILQNDMDSQKILQNDIQLTIKEQLDILSKAKSEKKNLFLDTTYLSPRNKTERKALPMRMLVESKNKRDTAHFHNKINTIYKLTEECQYSQVFITYTSTLSATTIGKGEEQLKRLIAINQQINKDFNEFRRILFKQKVFRKHLTTADRIYINSNEFTKKDFLHTHFLLLLPPEHLTRFIDTFNKVFQKHAKRLNMGRTEVVIPKDFYNKIKNSGFFKEVTISKEKSLIVEGSDRRNKHFYYIKTLKESIKKGKDGKKAKDIATLKYAVKYIYKNFKEKMDKPNKVSNMDALYSLTGIRRINFSRFLFPRYLYEGLKDKNGTPIHKNHTLLELTRFYRAKQVRTVLKNNISLKNELAKIETAIKKDDTLLNTTGWEFEIEWDLDEIFGVNNYISKTFKEREAKARVEARSRILDLLNIKSIPDFDTFADFKEEHLKDESFSYNFENKYTIDPENPTISGKYLKYAIIDGEKYYMDYTIHYDIQKVYDATGDELDQLTEYYKELLFDQEEI